MPRIRSEMNPNYKEGPAHEPVIEGQAGGSRAGEAEAHHLVANEAAGDFDEEVMLNIALIIKEKFPQADSLHIESRRVWEKYVRELQTKQKADMPLKTCFYCTADIPIVELFCPQCHTKLSSEEKRLEKAPLKESHEYFLGYRKPEQWRWVARVPPGKEGRESQRAKAHHARARKEGYSSVPQRFKNDLWYRQTMEDLGFSIEDMRRFEAAPRSASRI